MTKILIALFATALLIAAGLAAFVLSDDTATDTASDTASDTATDTTNTVFLQSELVSESELGLIADPSAQPIAQPEAGSVWTLSVGDCWDSASDEEFVDNVVVVDCAGPHEAEIFDSFLLEPGDYPGIDRVQELASRGCLVRFETYTGVVYAESLRDYHSLYPTPKSWAVQGDREVLCSINGSELADAANNAASETSREIDVFDLVTGDCFDEPAGEGAVSTLTRVECAEPHDAEAFLVFEIDGLAEYPGDDEIYRLTEDRCIAEFEVFVGFPYLESDLDVFYFTPTQQSWELSNDRVVQCAVVEVDGSKLVGSAGGVGR